MHPFTQIIKPATKAIEAPSASRLHSVPPSDLNIKAMTARAKRCGASLITRANGALVIRRGASIWHCTDVGVAALVLRTLSASAWVKGVVA